MSKRFRIGTLPLIIAALVILLYWLSGSLFPPPYKPDATWTRVKQTGVLRIGIDPSFPPFSKDDGKGNLSGFDIALAEAIAAKWGVRIQYIWTGYDGLYDALTANQFDMILSALPYNPLKTEDVYFTHSYFNGGPVVVVRRDDGETQSWRNLGGHTVAVELGTGGDIFGRRWQRRLGLDLREMNTTVAAIQSVETGQARAAIVDPISFYDFTRSNPAASLKMVGPPLASELYVIAVRKDSPTLQLELNAAIDTMMRDGSLQELQKKWF